MQSLLRACDTHGNFNSVSVVRLSAAARLRGSLAWSTAKNPETVTANTAATSDVELSNKMTTLRQRGEGGGIMRNKVLLTTFIFFAPGVIHIMFTLPRVVLRVLVQVLGLVCPPELKSPIPYGHTLNGHYWIFQPILSDLMLLNLSVRMDILVCELI